MRAEVSGVISIYLLGAIITLTIAYRPGLGYTEMENIIRSDRLSLSLLSHPPSLLRAAMFSLRQAFNVKWNSAGMP